MYTQATTAAARRFETRMELAGLGSNELSAMRDTIASQLATGMTPDQIIGVWRRTSETAGDDTDSPHFAELVAWLRETATVELARLTRSN